MAKKAIIYDLDNTIYPVSAIGDTLFAPLFDTIRDSGQHDADFEAIRKDIMKTPFRLVAKRYNFSEALTKKGIAIQENLEYKQPIATFDDYPEILNINSERFLVTTGFLTMQQSKIEHLGIKNDFREIHIVDPTKSNKKEVFAAILQRYDYIPDEVIVVGDDIESEIAAAKALGIHTVLYTKSKKENEENPADFTICNFSQLKAIYGAG